jgi:hypothetical protein
MRFLPTLLACAAGLAWTASAALANDPFWALLAPLEAPTATPQAREGEVFLSARAQHRRVGFLENDIRGTGLVNSDRIVIPRGTPVYYAAFGSSRTRFSPGRRYEGWCGVVRENERDRGYCMLREGSGYVLGQLPGNGSFYLPTRLADYGLRPITTPEVRVDVAARSRFPEMTLSYALDAWRPEGLVLERSAQIDGRQVELGSLWFERAEDGNAVLAIGQYAFTIAPAQNGEAVTVAPLASTIPAQTAQKSPNALP